MLRQELTRALDRFDKSVGEVFAFELLAHRVDQALPEFGPAFLVHSFVAHDRELLRAWRHEDEDGITAGGSVHPELLEFFLRGNQRLADLATLDEDPDFA